MTDTTHIVVLSRRNFVVAATASSLVLHPLLAYAEQGGTTLEQSATFAAEFAKIVNGATPAEGGITLELPEIAENGNFVPVTITVESPMTDADHVKALHLLSTANPVARVATFHLSPVNGAARVQSRMRLAKTQDGIVLTEHSTGKLAIATVLVKVTLGGCAG